MLFKTFIRLLYISYLDCETTLKQITLVTMGLISGLILFTLLVMNYILPDFADIEIFTISSTLWDCGVIITLCFLFITLFLLGSSFLYILYLYDNKSWKWIKLLKKTKRSLNKKVNQNINVFLDQLVKDEQEHNHKKRLHDKSIRNKVKKIKETDNNKT